MNLISENCRNTIIKSSGVLAMVGGVTAILNAVSLATIHGAESSPLYAVPLCLSLATVVIGLAGKNMERT